MRNIARHERAFDRSIASASQTLLHFACGFGIEFPDGGAIQVGKDD